MRAGRLSASIFAALIACGAAAQTGPSPDPPATTDAATEAPAGGAAPDSSAPPAQDTQAAPAPERPSDAAPQTPPPATPTPPPTPAPAPPATASVLDKRLIQGVLGKDVRSSSNEDMGRIVDVIVDRSGQTRAAVIDFGGFLGVGSRRIAVDWNALHFTPDEKASQVTLDLTRDQLKEAPEYKEGKPVVVLGPSGNTETVPEN
ncbi:MAG TPA: PRC-barrel domain-containing protein [Alphaproteobacteria bacterium]